MKKLVMALLLVCLLPISINAGDRLKTVTLCSSEEIAASGNYTSGGLDLRDVDGYFSLQLSVTGDGTLKAEFLMSNDGTTFSEPESASDICSGIVKTSGPGSDGELITQFTPDIGRYMKIKITETGTSNSVTVTAVLSYK